VSGITDAVDVSAGGDTAYILVVNAGVNHTCARLSTGAVKCWGKNSYGQLGTGNTTDSKTPVSVSGLTSGVVSIGLGKYHSCAVISDGTAKCWGRNTNGQIGNGDTTNQTSPAAVSGLTNATVAGRGASAEHSCVRTSNKNVKCWGKNQKGQLGDSTTVDSSTPVVATNVIHGLSVAIAAEHTCVRQDDSTLMCWGSNASGQLASQPTYTTAVAPPCRATGVERSDYFVGITTANMPDSTLNGLAAEIDVHRVKPIMFPESCTPEHAALLVHGRTVEASAAFDLQYQDYSFMERLAMAGIDAFTMNHLGYGRSSGLDVMDNPCNASLPACLDIGQTCPPPVGVLCDCGLAATFGINDKNQQGSTRYLNPNPLGSTCAHTSSTRFNNTTTMVAELASVVDDVLAKSGLPKVNLIGYSAGGIDVGSYLGEADNTIRAARTAKVERVIFVSSLFGLPLVPATEPNTGTTVHSYPLGVMDFASATNGGFNIDPNPLVCPGQRDPDIVDPIWAAVKARDTVGAAWGPSNAIPAREGLSRFAHATRWGWNQTAAARITVPVLVMHGLRDNVVAVATSTTLYGALTGTSSKVIVQIGCASHSIFWEGCNGGSCNGWRGPHDSIGKNALDWIKTGMIYASPGAPNGSYESTANDGTNFHTESPTNDGPDASEENQLP
jgi:pimeloyl-ACP methyl ester carboxylesterase